MLHTKTNWIVTLHWYPHATAANVQPVSTDFSTLLRDDSNDPSLYQARKWQFDGIPTRDEFVEVLESIPWSAVGFEKDLLPGLKSGQFMFPIMTIGHKGAHADLMDRANQKVGVIEIWKEEIYVAKGYVCPIILDCEIEGFVKRAVKSLATRDQAMQSCIAQKPRILEYIIQSETHSPFAAVKQLLVNDGFVQGKKKKISV